MLRTVDLDGAERVANDLRVMAFRRWEKLAEADNQSELIRETMELFARVVERYEESERFAAEADAYLRERTPAEVKEDEEWRDAVMRWTAERWRED